MSIIVRNMEMPKRCFECPCCCAVGNFECLLAKKDLRKEHGINISRPNWCPLVEIPPHGDLVDRTELLTEYDRQHKGPAGGARRMIWGDIYKQFKKEYSKTEVSDYRPFVEGYLPWRRSGIIVWLKNGDVLAYFPKNAEAEGSEE